MGAGNPTPAPSAGAARPSRLARLLGDWLPALPLILVAGALLLTPCLVMLRASFATATGSGFTLANWIGVFGSRSAQTAIGDSLLLAFAVATIALVVGAPLAWVLSRMARGSRSLYLGLLNVAANFSGIGIGFAFVAALGTYGMVTLMLRSTGLDLAPPPANSFWGLVIAYEYTNVPMFVLFSLPAMSLLREEWWEAAKCCSASRAQFWWHIGWPVLRPFLLASWLLIFTWSVGMYGTPVALMGESPNAYPLITIDMSRTLQGSLFGSQRMPVMAVILMVFAIVSLLLFRLLTRRGLKWLT
ncbi:ABC transporter permease [Aureimonas endophytica]|uniref:ABC transporter permease n=1 Tax=Aureimonas endophytica TaxID=2027858 RepID=A0A916ZNH9_9HYPH|nr:ABC transporter permease subunit [Aureimonas endophytica]GGE04914.1 ABC transporter permease [Aureimonas endophytica]